MQGATGAHVCIFNRHMCFNPRPLCRERRGNMSFPPIWYRVSIHAPYAGSDVMIPSMPMRTACFNPRPLCRERPEPDKTAIKSMLFQSTPPMQGATRMLYITVRCCKFQSTPPMQGATRCAFGPVFRASSFNPRPLCRERLHQLQFLRF